ASSYPRKHFIFESGATTLVGLDEHMPLRHLLQEIGLSIDPVELKPPMRVYLSNGEVLTRYHDLDAWIAEAERVFGPKGQRAFWKECYRISQFVWETSLQQRAFPPSSLTDLWEAIKHFRPRQLSFATLAFRSMDQMLRKYGLRDNEQFVAFINEQLMITAQNTLEEVNLLFGSTALCYTNYTNYYMPGGLINLVKPLVAYIEERGGEVKLREGVQTVQPQEGGYFIQTKKGEYRAKKLLSAIPINNTVEIFKAEQVQKKYRKKMMQSEELNSAFSLGFVAEKFTEFDCLHHQIHLQEPLPFTGSESIFLSLSHPEDTERCGPDQYVGSVSTHVPHPAATMVENK
ncbi:MAG: FAD-dependent oxidoreductase, partial [Bacteroidota bacterium]